jgi:hypothetical protein
MTDQNARELRRVLGGKEAVLFGDIEETCRTRGTTKAGFPRLKGEKHTETTTLVFSLFAATAYRSNPVILG